MSKAKAKTTRRAPKTTATSTAGRRRTATSTKKTAASASTKKTAAAKKTTRKRPTQTTTRRTSTPRRPTPASYGLGPHEATYSGVQFRSQLEARWAVFFDMLGWDWDYEPCHYPVGPNLGYLPDFYLPRFGLWVEGKGPTFLDAAAMGKIINGAAGPQPLPLRDPPYWPNNGILLAGPMLPLTDQAVPVHTWVRAAQPGQAQAWTARLTHDGIETIAPKPFATYPATGAKPARRPTAVRTVQLLTPSPVPGLPVDPAVMTAYQVALAVRFDGTTTVLPQAPLVRHLNDRRRGRPYRAGGVVLQQAA